MATMAGLYQSYIITFESRSTAHVRASGNIHSSCKGAYFPLSKMSFDAKRRLTIRAAEENTEDKGSGISETSEADLEALEARLGVGRRRRKGFETEAEDIKPPSEKKDWESMSLAEKAWEFYIGEKGLLFWLNKLAYAAIFTIAGGWIVFRFIGPALGFYELDSPLLPPDKAF